MKTGKVEDVCKVVPKCCSEKYEGCHFSYIPTLFSQYICIFYTVQIIKFNTGHVHIATTTPLIFTTAEIQSVSRMTVVKYTVALYVACYTLYFSFSKPFKAFRPI